MPIPYRHSAQILIVWIDYLAFYNVRPRREKTQLILPPVLFKTKGQSLLQVSQIHRSLDFQLIYPQSRAD